ncbi:PREDICTED: ubiquitin carboxyl-terminal hydrolase 10 [Cyphomyrmex costatus]|uniref:ubiquitinyl hydrolase 1 n=1 Tax=Cyphomyrmex costatus TaxID=456900 RepID=A0A151ID72_9HYME|nr:PREDICTED: ubiquitin carboxyl-terminal hydrolase 10 [Cyphomyrmex costatus]KYM98351.1 Ubiquitin carboxyl-terminal hydrolase 10 [Cyphomyrmex costatus]
MNLQFLDLHDLTDNDKRQIFTILKSDITEALKLPWDAKNIEGNNNNVNSVAIAQVPELQQHHWYNAMPPAPTYPQQLMTQMCNDWQAPMYNVSANGHIPPFISGVAYAHPGYNLGAEIQEMNYSRENGRRNSRGRGIRRDNYNRILNPTNEVQSGYMGDQAQYQIPIMYIYPDHSVSTQQVATGQVYFTQPIYSTIPHPHPNAQSVSSNSHAHLTYPQQNHQAPQINRSVRQSVPSQQPNQEPAKNQEPVVQFEKHVQSISDKSAHQVNENNSLPSNVANTVIVNPTLETPIKNVNENTADRKNVISNEKVNANLQNNIVWTVNENCNGTEKVDVPSVMNTKVDVKENQNNETDKKFKNETIPSIATNAIKTSPKSISIGTEKNETQIEENIALKDAQDKTIIKTPNNSSTMPNDSSITPNTSSSSISETPPAAPTIRSFASLFKKDNKSETHTSCKPVEHITCQNEPKTPKTPVQKESTSPVRTPENQNNSSSTPTLQNGIAKNCYNDPNIYRIGEFLSSYQMDKQTVSLLPRGLTNRSNYCYINSILQALLACPPFYNLLTALPLPIIRNENSATPVIDNMVQFVREFTPLTEAARMPRKDRVKRGEDTVMDIYSGIAFEPAYIYKMLQYLSVAYAFSIEGRQEDAEEFLSCLINAINDEMLALIKLINTDQNAIGNAKNISNDHDEEEWQVMGPKNKGAVTRCTEFGRTPISDIFRGQLRSRVIRAGEQPTDNVQPFFTLQLDVQKAESVRHALEILVGKDQVEGMTCSKTRQQIEAWKQLTLEELPVILILHLKWFVYKFDKYSNGCSKILKTVEFPIDLKIDGKILSPNTAKKLGPKQKQYKLFAVTYHDGKEATKGHYFTDAFHVGYGCWVRYDDSTVKSITESNVLRPTSPRVPYLLYYRRCDTIGNNQSSNAKAH